VVWLGSVAAARLSNCSTIEFSQPAEHGAVSSGFKSNMVWNTQLDFRPGSQTAPDFETCTDSFGAFAHSGKAEVSVAAGLQHLFVDTTAIIANHDPHLSGSVFELDCNSRRAGMTKCIQQCLASNAVNVVMYG